MQSQKRQNDLCSSPRQTIQYHGNQVHAPTSNAEEAVVERFFRDLQDLLELTPQKDILFIIGHWKCKSRKSRSTWSNKFGFGVRNEAGQIEFCKENTLVIANTIFQQHKRRVATGLEKVSFHSNPKERQCQTML